MMLVLTVFFRYANGKVLRIMIEQKLAVHEKDEAAYELVLEFVCFWVNVGQPPFGIYTLLTLNFSQVISWLLKF